MLKNFARVLAAGAFVLAAILPTTASASAPVVAMSIAPTVTVSDKQILTLTVTQTCPLLVDFNGQPVFNSFGFAGVQQVQGRLIAHAGGSLTTVCDGLQHTSIVTALAFDHPFRSGSGVAQASVFNLCGMDPTTFLFQCISGSALQSVLLVAIH
jgi:hypothetical protein